MRARAGDIVVRENAGVEYLVLSVHSNIAWITIPQDPWPYVLEIALSDLVVVRRPTYEVPAHLIDQDGDVWIETDLNAFVPIYVGRSYVGGVSVDPTGSNMSDHLVENAQKQ